MARRVPKSEQDVAREMQRLLGRHAADAVAVLLSLMRDEGQKPELRVKVAESVLDRVWGKAGGTPPQTGEAQQTTVSFEGVLKEWSE
jgi:hypothetical protein